MKYKVIFILFGLIGIIVIGLIVWLCIDLTVAPRIEKVGNVLIIHDSYRREIDLTDAEISLCEEKITITKRIAGTSAKDLRKGVFVVTNNEGEAYLSLMRCNEEYIKIVNNDGYFYINLTTKQETTQLYQELTNNE